MNQIERLAEALKCADLARAMGWDFIPSSSEIALPGAGEWYTPLGKIYGDEPPNPFTDHADCHALMEWMALPENRERWDAFLEKLTQSRDIDSIWIDDYTAPVYWGSDVKTLMTSAPAVKAEAAWRAIQEKQ